MWWSITSFEVDRGIEGLDAIHAVTPDLSALAWPEIFVVKR